MTPRPADGLPIDPVQAPFYWACTNSRRTQAHIVDMRTFMDDYRALCGVSAYANDAISWTARPCQRCRTAHGRLTKAEP